MKLNRIILLATLLPAFSVMQAQTSYDAVELLGADLKGTARFVGMGGAMGALGADISTMGTNPAGIGLYRKWDMSMSYSGNGVTQHSKSNLNSNHSYDSFGSLDNVGIVVANKVSNEDVLRFFNFGVNYRNVTRFDGKMGMMSNLDGLSQTGQMALQAYDNMDGVDYIDFEPGYEYGFFQDTHNLYHNCAPDRGWVGWLTLLGAQSHLIDVTALGGTIGGVEYPGGHYYSSISNAYNEVISGGVDAYDFNVSANLMDVVYLGATLTTYNVDRSTESVYSEEFEGGGYTLHNFYRTVGTGYDFKFGAILRPISESSFRVGISATTPTIYTLYDYNSVILSSEATLYDYEVDGKTISLCGPNDNESWAYLGSRHVSFSKDTYDDGDFETKYTMIAPAKVNVSMGGTIGTSLALGVEYEYTDYGMAKLLFGDGNENSPMNAHIGEIFKAQETVRVGLEKMFSGSFYTRLGYNYQSSGYKKEAYKMIPVESVQTNTAYRNITATNNVTCGLGYRGSGFYFDAALLYSKQTADFYSFDDPDLEAVQLSRNLWKGTLTLGMRF